MARKKSSGRSFEKIIVFRATAEVAAKIKQIADEEEVSEGAVIRRLCREGLRGRRTAVAAR